MNSGSGWVRLMVSVCAELFATTPPLLRSQPLVLHLFAPTMPL